MFAIIVNEIEEKISQLSFEEQLRLIERLVRRLREDSLKNHAIAKEHFKSQLAAMANDPEIQAELKKLKQQPVIASAYKSA